MARSTGTGGTATPPSQTPSVTSTSGPYQVWHSYQDAMFGFQIDVPAALSSATGGQADAHSSDMGFSFPFNLGTPTPDQAPFAQLRVTIDATTAIDPAVCSALGKGTAIAVGGGLTGYQQDNLNATPAPGSSYVATVSASLVTGGVALLISLGAGNLSSNDQFSTQYGSVWQHMLASFVPGPAVSNTHPCS